MDLWMPSPRGKRPGGLRMNWHTKTEVEPQVTLHLDVHPPVLDTSGSKQTSGETIPKSDGGSKKGTGFGGQWLNSLCSMYHTLRSGSTPVTWVTPEAPTGQQPVLYELYPQSHFQYNIEPSRMYEPNNGLWYPAEPGVFQLGYLDPLTLWESPSFPYDSAAQSCSSELPHKFGISKVDQPLNPEAKEWIPRDYIKDNVSVPSPSSKKTSEVEKLNDKTYVISEEPQDPIISGGSLDFCEITDSEVDAVRLSVSSSSVDVQSTGVPQIEKKGFTNSSFESHTCNSGSFNSNGPQEVGAPKVEKESLSLSGSESHAVVVPVASDIKKLPSVGDQFSCGCGHTEAHDCDDNVASDTGTFSYASIVGKIAISQTDPRNAVGKTLQKQSTGMESVQRLIPRIFLKDKKYPKEKAAPSMDNKKNPVLFKSVNRKQKKFSRNFLKELRESSPVKVCDTDSVSGEQELGSPCLEFSASPSNCSTLSPVLGNSPVIASPRDKLTCQHGSPLLSTIHRAQHTVSESSSNSSHVRSTSESSIASVESIDIEFTDVVDRSSAAPDVFLLMENCQPKTSANPKYSGNILAHILNCDESESEDTNDESEDSDSDWDDICVDGIGSLELDDTWGILGPFLTPPESTKTHKSELSQDDDDAIISLVKPVCDTVCDDDDDDDDDKIFTGVSLEEINKRWEQEVENDVIGKSESMVKFGKTNVHPMHVWAYAFKMARRGPWEEYARDRVRFSHRIATVEPVISSVLQEDHRERVFQKLYGRGCRLS